ncbi:SIS domain-containing protein [Nocardia acidivorans]|uniref:SIS domain-containing protein n=1 Tax=Nocardia acidivorans TaxID=404580 RepID=UPI0008338147|nr:SIS domain-containing protein [Nocardia acidivorans]
MNPTRLGRLMEAEMRDQPRVLAALADRYTSIGAAVAALFTDAPGETSAQTEGRVEEIAAGSVRPSNGPVGVAFLARGSSDNAALLGRYAVELQTGLPTCLVAPSVATVYGREPIGFRGWLLIALSQSGRTPEIVDLTRRYAAAGAKVVAVTNDPDSALARAAHYTVALEAGPERAVPATKTVTGQMLAVLAIASGLGPGGMTRREAAELPAAAADLLADTASADNAAELIATVDRVAVVGRSACYPAALETALKLQETTGIMAHGFSSADFRHGPIAVTGPGAPAVLLAGSGPADSDTLELRAPLAARYAPTVLAGTATEAPITWPALGHLGECVLATIRGQQLALAVARELGIDADHPTGLAKVTLTH